MLTNYLGVYFGLDTRRSDKNFPEQVGAFFDEVAMLFSTNQVTNGKFLTEERITEMREMIKKYYNTEDFRDFQKTKSIYDKKNIDTINNNAKNGVLPLIANGGKSSSTPTSPKKKKSKS